MAHIGTAGWVKDTRGVPHIPRFLREVSHDLPCFKREGCLLYAHG